MGTNKNSCKTEKVMNLLSRGTGGRVLPGQSEGLSALGPPSAAPALSRPTAGQRDQSFARRVNDGPEPNDVPTLPQTRDIEVITGEILDAKRAGGEAILTIGRCLIEAKAMLSHGEWLPWLEERVEFSERSARNFMRLAREWTNRQALADLGATKALQILALPESERSAFLSEMHEVDGEEKTVIDMTSRELETAIKERDAALRAAEQAKADQSAAEQAREKLSQDMALANERIAGLNAEVEEHSARAREAQDAAARLEKELEELRARPVNVAVEADPAALEQARQEVEEAMQDKVDRATAARDAALQKRYDLEKDLQTAQEKAQAQVKELNSALQRVKMEREDALRELEELREQNAQVKAQAQKKAVLTSDANMALFQELFNQVQETANRMNGVLMKVRNKDPETAQRLGEAVTALCARIQGGAQG